ncbi:MAG: CPBP family intramembrane metalloprotease [Prolixibacteraceae bacterium]|nr:CPBP family intramembrane metalloprotease [Prolixibacteraceae bacterium]
MRRNSTKYYPSILEAANLVILYIFIQTIIDFPLALWDYFHGTEYLYDPVKKIILGIGSIAFIWIYSYIKAHSQWKDLFPFKRFNLLIFIPSILFLVSAQTFLDGINQKIIEILPPPAWFNELFAMVFDNKLGFWGTFMKVVIIAPFVEESIFRGIIMHGFMRNYPAFIAVFVSALFFALFHLNPWQFSATFLLGLLLGTIMIITRNIFACMAVHSINNFIVLISIKYWSEIEQSVFYLMPKKDLYYLSYLIFSFSIVLITLFAVSKKSINKI